LNSKSEGPRSKVIGQMSKVKGGGNFYYESC